MKPTSLIESLCSLANPDKRIENANEIAQALGAEQLLIFIYDSEVYQFLPAEGFPQTISHARAWQTFLRTCQKHTNFSGSIASTDSTDVHVTGISYKSECILVLVGGKPKANYREINLILPLLSALLHREQSHLRHSLQLKLAEDTTAKAQELARKIDIIRQELREALSDRDAEIRTRKLTEESLSTANAKLLKLNEDLLAKQDKLNRTENMLDNLLKQSRSYDR